MAQTLAQDIAIYQAIPVAKRTAKQSAALATDLATRARQAASSTVAQGGTVIAGSAPAAAVASAQNPTAASTFVPPASWGQPIDLTRPSIDTYVLAQQWAYAIANPAAAKASGSIFAQVDQPMQAQAGGALANVKTYGQFQLNQLETQIIGQGAAYFPTQFYSPIPQAALQAGGVNAAGVGAYQQAFNAAGGTIVTRPEQSTIGSTFAPSGGNAASLIPPAVSTSPITSQGSGTPVATSPIDTGTGVANVPTPTSGAGGAFYGGATDTGTTTSSGMTTADMILIGIGAVGLLLAMKGKKHAPV